MNTEMMVKASRVSDTVAGTAKRTTRATGTFLGAFVAAAVRTGVKSVKGMGEGLIEGGRAGWGLATDVMKTPRLAATNLQLPTEGAWCSFCGNEVSHEQNFCGHCGGKLD